MSIVDQINLSLFPTTRYQGSKRKILPWLYEIVKELKYYTVLDACGGTASVSYLFKTLSKSVTYNDKLHFNYLIGKAIIENSKHTLTTSDIEKITKKYKNKKYSPFIQNTFKDIYYLKEENEWLDMISRNIIDFNSYSNEVNNFKKALALYGLFQSCLIKRPFNLFHRSNLSLRTSDVERNFGNKASWDKPFEHHYRRFLNEANNLVFNNGQKCISKNENIFQIDPYGYDLVYFDIPYLRSSGNNESSDYLKCYHFLEGLSDYNNWEDYIDHSTINCRFNKDITANEFNIEDIHLKIEELFYRFRKSKIIFSYKKGGTPSIEYIFSLMKKLKNRAWTRSIHYKYALNKQNGNAKDNREVLIIGI